ILYKYMGRFDDARRLYMRALKILRKNSRPEHASLADLYHNIGGLEHARGRYRRGEPFARCALAIRQMHPASNPERVAADMAALAALLEGQRKYDEAELLYHRALSIFEQTLGAEHYEIAVTLNNLATLSQSVGRTDEAEKLYRRTLNIKQKILGRRHP